MASPDRPVRPPRPQHELTVVSTEQVGPHLVRVVLTGDSLADFGAADHTDAYVKLQFTDAEGAPLTRTYTCLLYTSPSPRDRTRSRMPSSA